MGNLCIRGEQSTLYQENAKTHKKKIKKLQQIKQRYQEDQQYIIDESEEKSSRGSSMESSRFTQSSRLLVKKVKTLSQYNNSYTSQSLNLLDPEDKNIKNSISYCINQNANNLLNSVTTNSYIRIKHAVTMRNLHSHYVRYETGSKGQEVSACSGERPGTTGPGAEGCEYDQWEVIKFGNLEQLRDELMGQGIMYDCGEQSVFFENVFNKGRNEKNSHNNNNNTTNNNHINVNDIEMIDNHQYNQCEHINNNNCTNVNQSSASKIQQQQQFQEGGSIDLNGSQWTKEEQSIIQDQILRGDDVIALRHVMTGKYLSSSPKFKSPKQNLQEVSCVEKKSKDIYWKIEIVRKYRKNYIKNDEKHNCIVRLGDIVKIVHLNSNGCLHTESKKQGIIQGQREVICCHKQDKCDLWAIDDIFKNPNMEQSQCIQQQSQQISQKGSPSQMNHMKINNSVM